MTEFSDDDEKALQETPERSVSGGDDGGERA